MHLKSCFNAINKAHLSRYKYLQNFKSAKNGLVNNHSHKMISSISRLHYKSSEAVNSKIQRNSRGMSLSNLTAMSDISSFGTGSITSSNCNQIFSKKKYIVDENYQKNILIRHTLK